MDLGPEASHLATSEELSVYPVAVVYDCMNSQVELQILRDFSILAHDYPVALVDPKRQVNTALMDEAGINITLDPPVLCIVYRTGEEWPEPLPGIPRVARDLKPTTLKSPIDPNPKVGYYLRPQGRDGANLTEVYLNRAHPRGNGVTDALLLLMWS
jgi:hypothetical protein